MMNEIDNIKRIIESGDVLLALQLAKGIGWDLMNVLNHAWDCRELDELRMGRYCLWHGSGVRVFILQYYIGNVYSSFRCSYKLCDQCDIQEVHVSTEDEARHKIFTELLRLLELEENDCVVE